MARFGRYLDGFQAVSPPGSPKAGASGVQHPHVH